MIKGILKWSDKRIRYSQESNATEAIIKKVLAENGIKRGYLESCGASAYCTITEGMGFDWDLGIQADDFVMMRLNDPKNDKLFSAGNSFDNRAMRNYKTLYERDMKRKCTYKKSNWKEITEALQNGDGVQLCLKKPGHYIACLAYDDSKNIILYSDSWGSRPGLKNQGWHEVLTEKEYNNNVIDLALIYQ